MDLQVRARFAPAPTGHLHVGGARTALFNWLFSRRTGGRLILRIDDTDRKRSSEDSYEAILDTLRWLGIDWDEGPDREAEYGPYRQSQRFHLYRQAAERLENSGFAYRCYCTVDELAARRDVSSGKSDKFGGYDRKCRYLEQPPKEKKDFVLRFAVPTDGQLLVEDLIRGDVRFDLSTIEDFILLRADGTPTFTLAGSYDDWAMEISHVVRGEDLLSVTPRQILISRALGRDSDPVFAHLPLIVGADRTPLSKRHGDVAVSWYRNAGFLPEALLNYLALLGWGPKGDEEILSVDEIIAQFRLDEVSRTPAKFDLQKLDWINNHYLQKLPVKSAIERALPFLVEARLINEPPTAEEMLILEHAIPLVQVRVDRLSEIPEMIGFLLRAPYIDARAWAKVMSAEWGHDVLAKMIDVLENLDPWDSDSISSALRLVAEAEGVKPRQAFGPLRVAISGKAVGPPLFESLEILGKSAAIDRAKIALSLLEAHGSALPEGEWPLE